MLVFGVSPALAQSPVVFDVGTSTGNDTLFVGIPGSIIFTVDPAGNKIQGLVFPFQLMFSAGNWIGPMSDAADGNALDNVFPSAAAAAAFASIAWNPNYGQGTDPDTLLYGFTSFGGPYTTAGEAWRIDVTPTGEGTVRFDTVLLPPANQLAPIDPQARVLPFEWLGEGKVIYSITAPCVPGVCMGVTVEESVYVFGDLVRGSINGFEPTGYEPSTYSLASAVNSNGTGPNNPIVIDDAGNWWWQTDNSNEADVGTWTLNFEYTSGIGYCEHTDACPPLTFEVIAQKPLASFRFDCVEAFSGSDIYAGLYLDNLLNPCKELGVFDLLFQYDPSLLSFLGLDIEGSVLESSGWEYLTYRLVSDNPAKVRIVAIADMNNSNQHPSEFCVDGLIANLKFRTTNDRSLACQSAWLMFTWDDCGDNTASSRDGNELYIIADPANGPWVGGIAGEVPGGGIINSSCGITAQLATFQGGTSGPADFPCIFSDPNKPDPIECLYFVNGKVKIKCPGDIDDRGDMNLNGLTYEIADAVLYSNYFIQGPSVFAPGVQREAQVAASDINADGVPLTVADLVYLIRVITGDADPIAEDLLGGGPKVAAVVGKLDVTAAHQGAVTTIQTSSDLDVGAGLFVFNYENTEIASVSVMGRAADMDVEYTAENGELRVLVLNIADRAKIVAGSGDILQVATTGGGSLELVNVEAATFMGGTLESNVSAKIVPTAFALHQNFPNPFNPSTSMALDFPNASDYTLTIYNITGQVVKTYAGNAEAGTLTVTWDGTDNRGARVASGVYFSRFDATEFSATKKMLLVK
jgi:hypothetical protein